jgi:imidazolonepropionase-like amidohydrolase
VALAQDIAVRNATVYTSPDATAQLHTTILIEGGKIVAVGPGVSVPSGVQTLSCRGCVVFEGFWNTHVHFTGSEWNDAVGGTLLFGTDTGFLTDYDVKEEYRQLGLAGLSFHDVLAMLTTSPATKFKVSAHSGTIRTGNDGDLTILLADPAAGELQDFSRVAYTIGSGRVIFDATAH